MTEKPSGIGSSLPRHTTIARRCGSFVDKSRSPSPMRRQRSEAHGTSVIKLSALCSIKKPPSWVVCSTPPSRPEASNSETSIAGADLNQPMRRRQPADPAADHGHTTTVLSADFTDLAD